MKVMAIPELTMIAIQYPHNFMRNKPSAESPLKNAKMNVTDAAVHKAASVKRIMYALEEYGP